jgi:hypothetical protein
MLKSYFETIRKRLTTAISSDLSCAWIPECMAALDTLEEMQNQAAMLGHLRLA